MVVVLIIGIVYGLVLGKFNPKQYVQLATFKTLKSAIIAKWKEGDRIDLYLYDNCKKSALFKNGEYQEKMTINIKPKMFSDITVYKTDPFEHERKIDFVPIVIDDKLQPVCFQFTLYPNGSSSNYIVKQKEQYFVFHPYFEDVNETETLEDALEDFTHQKQKKISSYE